MPEVPALVVGEVRHTRRQPIRHGFRNRTYQWLVDVEDLPRLPRWIRPLARFDVADHLDGARLGGGIRGDLARFLAGRGVFLAADDRVLMLANARVLGHVFDPLTVFWCLRPDNSVVAIVFEVHNTYGERHAYLLDVDDAGRAQLPKTFYVSPFNDVTGHYDVRTRLTDQVVSTTIALTRDGEAAFSASTRGTPRRATVPALLRAALTHPLMTQRTSALIRLHGIWLWLRRLPIMPRPPHSPEAVR
ncbi:DUF1365 domain-containing protein [Cumulibacter manganitolerans]|uniref:DUF1365 domain-containing protein n=1 Tax=Cumulibacter manganitolerans TaxID=1884992 RepID=UPI001E62F500|nr:DUF1365 domain-containing protein [Cumulibacter manganitolerans]